MKIGFVRHYKVKKSFPKRFLIGYPEIKQWFDDYELAEIETLQFDSGTIEWNICYSSPAKRAIETAAIIFNRKPVITNELKELNVLNLMNTKLKLPFVIWGLLTRNKSLSQNETTTNFSTKISSFVDSLLSKDEDNVLIVSHGFVMMYLQKELIKRGFTRNNFKSPVSGKVYEFGKDI